MEAEPGPARESLNDRVQGTLGELGKILRQGILYAEYTEKNRIFRGKAGDYYSKYMEMREEQRQLLKRISLQVYFLKKPYAQGKMVADFLRETAASLSEHNNAGSFSRRWRRCGKYAGGRHCRRAGRNLRTGPGFTGLWGF